jgi:hypothetical protein
MSTLVARRLEAVLKKGSNHLSSTFAVKMACLFSISVVETSNCVVQPPSIHYITKCTNLVESRDGEKGAKTAPCKHKSGRWDSNPRPSPWQGDVLPAELHPLVSIPVGKVGLEPTRIAPRDPKSRSSASSDTPPFALLYHGFAVCTTSVTETDAESPPGDPVPKSSSREQIPEAAHRVLTK